MIPKYLLTFGCLILWLLTFSIGAFIDTNPLRAELNNAFDIGSFLLVVSAWIPTNLGILSILAGLSGALCRSLLRSLEVGVEQIRPVREGSRIIGGGIAGLMFYLSLMAGAFLLMDDPFETTTKQQYFRIAGVVSFMAFLAGFRPDLLRRILDKIPGF
ncbi:MAG TPA: hypothetical protein VK168_16785 [Saprospiraceae bacterium]|nr:hypothetical protein [Saprospiraceae bacterium]